MLYRFFFTSDSITYQIKNVLTRKNENNRKHISHERYKHLLWHFFFCDKFASIQFVLAKISGTFSGVNFFFFFFFDKHFQVLTNATHKKPRLISNH